MDPRFVVAGVLLIGLVASLVIASMVPRKGFILNFRLRDLDGREVAFFDVVDVKGDIIFHGVCYNIDRTAAVTGAPIWCMPLSGTITDPKSSSTRQYRWCAAIVDDPV